MNEQFLDFHGKKLKRKESLKYRLAKMYKLKLPYLIINY
jgi:hypothetical protein